ILKGSDLGTDGRPLLGDFCLSAQHIDVEPDTNNDIADISWISHELYENSGNLPLRHQNIIGPLELRGIHT
ncbi:hypothetical protein NL388_36010, partial [Klebsiella pneumoniae]|nr:hypothetical protein [Klebsiella pneumoniae]